MIIYNYCVHKCKCFYVHTCSHTNLDFFFNLQSSGTIFFFFLNLDFLEGMPPLGQGVEAERPNCEKAKRPKGLLA